MNGLLCNRADTLLIAPGDLHELVRGQERELVERLMPIVQNQNVTLDLAQVERIDAAGIAALISLYGCAFNKGNEFNVVNATPHVTEILAIVGLDRILLNRNAVTAAKTGPCFVQSAA
jgi:anti-anti-sigma factor